MRNNGGGEKNPRGKAPLGVFQVLSPESCTVRATEDRKEPSQLQQTIIWIKVFKKLLEYNSNQTLGGDQKRYEALSGKEAFYWVTKRHFCLKRRTRTRGIC